MTRFFKVDPCSSDEEQLLDSVGFDLGRFPALRHIKIQRQIPFSDNRANLRFVQRLLSSSSSGIETLEIEITWNSVENEHEKDLFSSDAGWAALDQLFTSKTFGSLSKVTVVLCLHIEKVMDSSPERTRHNDLDQHVPELERNLTPYVDNLFPLFRTLTNTRRTLETQLDVIVVEPEDDDDEQDL
jgi:hypothetical protein